MLDLVYEWLQNMVFFLLLAGVILDALPGNSYRKYVRFFAGMIVVLLLISPLLKLGGLADVFDERYRERDLEWMAQEKEQMESYFEQAATAVENADREEKIEVEEIRIGE